MNQHTPGPWRVGDAGATVFGPKSDKPVPEIVATVRHRTNVRLIAAAPEMYELLKAYVERWQKETIVREAAIALLTRIEGD